MRLRGVYSDKQWLNVKFCSRDCNYANQRGKSMIERIGPDKARKVIEAGRQANIGRKHAPRSEQTRIKLSTANSGSKNKWWRGGITIPSRVTRNSREYRVWRKSVLERDSYSCTKCDRPNNSLYVHIMGKTVSEWTKDLSVSCAYTLCRDCHYESRRGKVPYVMTFEVRFRMSKGKTGKYRGVNNPRWNGGGTHTERERVWHLGEYQQWRRAVFERDDYTCRNCFKRGGKLRAHHIKPWATHPELRYDIQNGLTLCHGCHLGMHRGVGSKPRAKKPVLAVSDNRV